MKPFNFLLLRTPLHPLKNAYHPIKMNSLFEEGVYLSSPEYWKELKKKDKETEFSEKIIRTLRKYQIRSSMRCTPYGTFAGNGLLHLTEGETDIVLANRAKHLRNIRLDMNYISELTGAILENPEIRNHVLFYPNNSIYYFENTLRYAEYTIKNNQRFYHLTSVSKTGYLEQILTLARNGIRLPELINMLQKEEEASESEAADFIDELWRSQLLVSELEPEITGKEPFARLIDKLNKIEAAEKLAADLEAIKSLLDNPGEDIQHYFQIEERLKGLNLIKEVPKNTFQTDLFLSLQREKINKEIVDGIVQQINLLKGLNKPVKNRSLEDFKARFYKKFEEAEVPLSIALDADVGVGYGSGSDDAVGETELIEGLFIRQKSGADTVPENPVTSLVIRKYQEYLQEGKNCIELSEEDLKEVNKESEEIPFPNSMFIFGSLLKKGKLFDKDNFCFDLKTFSGPSACNLIGRFTHGDSRLEMISREILKEEEKECPEAIYAELVHLPQARIGNILLRPVLRNFEIPYIGESGAEKDKQIPVEDILVSIQNDRIFLRSKKHNRQIIPRLTSAHNFSYGSLPVYKFLCDLQLQGFNLPEFWDWGSLSGLKYLPRVVFKNIILRKGRWHISEADISKLPESKDNYPSFFKAFREKYHLPAKVLYSEGDNTLLIDFTKAEGMELFIHFVKRKKNILLEEFLFSEENCIVKDIYGDSYANEIIIPAYEPVSSAHKDEFRIAEGKQTVQRKFLPHSEWLYFKIYCGNKTAERILKEILLPFVEEGESRQVFEKFFFIRYKDEASHIRLRFYNRDVQKQTLLLNAVLNTLEPYLKTGSIHKIALDTYSREIERYTPELIEFSESVFYADSLAVLKFISLLEGEESEKYRMLFALRGITILLDDFHFSLEEKSHFAQKLQKSFFDEFGGQPALQKQLNDKYRKYQKLIFSHLNPLNDEVNEIEEAVAVFRDRSKGIQKAFLEYSIDAESNKEKMMHLMASYIHMFMNRLFTARQRKYELVIYHFLERYYTSVLARSKKKKLETVL